MKLIGRKSGILLHITSLPSAFGIGDFGPEAYRFADFLADAGQAYWQVLPFNPTSITTGNSPYSSISAFAGNKLMISPELLVKEGFLKTEDLEQSESFNAYKVDFEEVTFFKNRLLDDAFENFKEKATKEQLKEYEYFCKRNILWLEDYCMYSALKAHFGGHDWSKWPEGIRDRKPEELAKVKESLRPYIEKEHFLQWVFFHQWEALKKYCASKGITFIGDIPFYVSYDSSDVWAHASSFKLDEQKTPTVVSGVPPDYFNEEGQLWGMPVYDWETMKDKKYDWWIERLKLNFSMFELVRLDHFRAFSAFWEVPAHHDTAKRGKYRKGPAETFFYALKEKFDQLPVIAEDLGDIDEKVRELMYEFDLPGMRLLQFAFEQGGWGEIDYLPHNHVDNCVVYPGTHDNDTIKAWYKNLSEKGKKSIDDYVLGDVTENNIHECFVRMAYMSVANLCIIPMQDLLGMGTEGKMNSPSVATGNWEWRLQANQVNKTLARKIRSLAEIYGRNNLKIIKTKEEPSKV